MKKASNQLQCTSDETCWCMEEVDENGSSTFPHIPDSYDTDKCLTPEQIEQLRLEEAIVDTLWDKYGKAMRGEK